MDALRTMSLVLAGAWLIAAVVTLRARQPRPALMALLIAGAQAVAGAWPELAPLTLAAWLVGALAVPHGRLDTGARRAIAGAGTLAFAGWAVAGALDDRRPGTAPFVGAAVVVALVALTGAYLRCRQDDVAGRRVIQWLTAMAVLAAAFGLACLALHVLAGTPDQPWGWLAAGLVLIPIGQAFAAVPSASRVAATVLVESIVVAGLTVLVVVVYLVVVVGLGRQPTGHERDVLLASLAAAVVVSVLALPARHRLVGFATALVGGGEPSADEVVGGFAARMSRAVPMDELMLQLAESLRTTMASGGAEIWVGADGVLNRTISVPTRPAARLALGDRERVVVGRARVGGVSWATVWLPELVDPNASAGANGTRPDLRIAPVAHLGELLGLVVVRRVPGSVDFTEEDERLLVELARQLGLALHNVRLDSALQASLAELEQRNTELQASRLRIVSASDEARRGIERNLHDGAQQHLVALAVKLGLARQIAEDGDSVLGLLDDLRGDVQTTIAELRELAHGIYPPLLRNRGLGEALRTAVARSPLACSVDVDLPERYPEEAETAAYFCCLEALQNAGKHAGATAEVTVRVGGDGTALWFEVADDGVGFEAAGAASGHGFVNMRDRLGAIGGQLSVESTPGHGTRVSARIPTPPLRVAVPHGEIISS
ncbi:MAG TPA: GAF domain-containing sensor histidine kinase [Jatrophihabitantaceae bacterium]